jgi:hypothetical protein
VGIFGEGAPPVRKGGMAGEKEEKLEAVVKKLWRRLPYRIIAS